MGSEQAHLAHAMLFVHGDPVPAWQIFQRQTQSTHRSAETHLTRWDIVANIRLVREGTI